MAKLYGEIAAKALLTLDKSFARANGQPLDASEVYYSLAAAKEYAAGAQAYIGQKIVVIEDNVVTHYGIEDAAGNLKELGSKPVGDNSSIVVAEDGTVSLKGVGTLTFERDILGEDGEPTGEKEAVQYQPLMTAAGLVWVEPSKTTVEGLATLIDALSVRVKALEDDRVTEEELAAAVKAETDRAEAAEKALGERIDGIDFVDEDELTAAIEAARKLISAEIDSDVAVAQGRADDAYALAEAKVDATTYAADKEALDAEDAAIREIAEGVRDAFNTFMASEEIDETVNTLKEIQAEIAKMTDATELATALASKADLSYVDEELAKKQDVIPANTYDAYGAAADAEAAAKAHADSVAVTAKSEAITDAEGKLTAAKADLEGQIAAAIETAATDAEDKATAAKEAAIADADAKLDNKANAADVYTKNETYTRDEINDAIEEALSQATGGESAADVLVALNNYKKFMNTEVFGNEAGSGDSRIDTAEAKLANIEAGAQVNVIDTVVAADGAKITATTAGKTVTINDAALQTAIADVDGKATEALSKANANINSISAHDTRLTSVETLVSGGEGVTGLITDVANLKLHDTNHGAEFGAFKENVNGQLSALNTNKAGLDVTNALNDRISANETAFVTLNNITLPAINTAIAGKVDTATLADYYTKVQVDAITGTPETGKTLVDMIAAAKAEAVTGDDAVKALVTAEQNRADAEEKRLAGLIKTNADAIDGINVLLETVDNADAITSLKELAMWVDEHGDEAAEMAKGIKANADAIDLINHETNGILAQAKAHAEGLVNGIPVATAEALGLVKFDDATIKMNENNQLYVAEVSTDILTQGKDILVLNGGSAKEG